MAKKEHDQPRPDPHGLVITGDRQVDMMEWVKEAAENSATSEDVRAWVTEGRRRGARHVLVVRDMFDFSDYPVYVGRDERVRETERYGEGFDEQRVVEVYRPAVEHRLRPRPEEVVRQFDEREDMQDVLRVISLTGRHDLEEQLSGGLRFLYD